MEVKDREAQGCNREVASEGSVEQRCEPMNKNLMRRECRTSGLGTAKSVSIKGTERRLGGCAPKVDELTSGDLPSVRESELGGARAFLTGRQKSAESVVPAKVGKAQTV
jgi:hypothetical protein